MENKPLNLYEVYFCEVKAPFVSEKATITEWENTVINDSVTIVRSVSYKIMKTLNYKMKSTSLSFITTSDQQENSHPQLDKQIHFMLTYLIIVNDVLF